MPLPITPALLRPARLKAIESLTEEMDWTRITNQVRRRVFGVLPSTYTVSRSGGYRVQNNIAGYNVYIGVNALPDLTQVPTYSATLPISIATTPPGAGTKTYYVLVCAQDNYGLVSVNQYCSTITIDHTGAQVLPPVTTPTNLTLLPQAGGYVRVMAQYPGFAYDPYPATTWKVWIGSSPPNPAVDTPAAIVAISNVLGVSIGVLSPGTYYAAVGLYRATDTALSTTLTGTVVLPTIPTEPVAVPTGWDQP